MKNVRLRKTHPLVLIAAVILTVFSIIGSVALADMVPLTAFLANQSNESKMQSQQESQQESVAPEKFRKDFSFLDKTAMARVDCKFGKFNSVVKSKLSDCFNCGVIVAIETVSNDSGGSTTVADNVSLFEHQLDNYLDAHRKNARLIVLGEDGKYFNDDGDELESNSTTYVIKVRMQNGSQYALTQNTAPAHNVGDKIRLITEKTITA